MWSNPPRSTGGRCTIDETRGATPPGGCHRGGLALISGHTGSGKTSVTVQWAIDFASQGKKVAYHSQESVLEKNRQLLVSQFNDNFFETIFF